MNRIRCISLMCLACLLAVSLRSARTLSLSLSRPSAHSRAVTRTWVACGVVYRAQMRAAVEKDRPGGPVSLAGRAYGKEKSSITFEAIQNWQRRDGPCFGHRSSMDSRHKIDESL